MKGQNKKTKVDPKRLDIGSSNKFQSTQSPKN